MYTKHGVVSVNVQQEYVPLEGNRSNLVHTAWAMMGLIHAGQVSVLVK